MAQSDRRYHYRECGLDNIYLLNGFDPVETPRGVSVQIRDREGLHLAIGRCLVRAHTCAEKTATNSST
jgi:putative transcriptional regulator